MKITSALSLLLLLLPFSALDNAWAAATPDPHDDVLAAENDHFPPTLRQRELQRLPVRELPVPNGLLAHASGLLLSVMPPQSPLWAQIPVTVTPCLLYLFMSLQR